MQKRDSGLAKCGGYLKHREFATFNEQTTKLFNHASAHSQAL
jgi:hypothetical protein